MMSYREEVSKEELTKFEIEHFEGEIIVVDDLNNLDIVFDDLRNSSIVGFDTETRPTFKKGQHNKIAMLQLSTATKAYLFRINKIGLPWQLISILSDRHILKAGVAIRDDIKGLREWSDFEPAGFVELQDLVKKYGIKSAGLKKLSAIILGFTISKRQQVTNWEKNQLSDSQLIYAATDAWVCNKIYRKLINSAE
ncbi:MAG: 3'-5' exonuclease domain-containing protein 2 [Bacteroidales bacterium]|nr:3'-5' exonuclease domain-containing protein 2 [Bacteroidales bacterium]